MDTVEFNKKTLRFNIPHQDDDDDKFKRGLQFKVATSKMLHLEDRLEWCWNLDTTESRCEIPGVM